ncbi:MAG: DUF58 domain-containing protein [Planctomycetaceae bacterium]
MPRLRLLGLVTLAGIPLIFGVFFPSLAPLGVLLTVVAVAVALVDLLLTPSLLNIDVGREVRDVLSVGARNPVTISVKNRNASPVELSLHDEPPAPSAWFDLPARVTLASQQRQGVVYLLQPRRRGRNRFGRIHLRMTSRWGFWTLLETRDLTREVKIYPDIQAVQQVELLARQNRLAEAGVRLSRIRGRGSEFDRLREYRREDEYRHIDWKASARHQDLISREYVVERNQNVLLLLDSGRSMCNEADGVSHFDRCLNAAILLAYVALRQGDTVGFMACSNRLDRWTRPVRGRSGLETLVSQVYDLSPTYEATDYALMIEELRRRYRKRSLVILLTHALDELHLATIAEHVRQLRSPHLVLSAFLQNVPLAQRLQSMPETDLDAFQIAAAAEVVSLQEAEIAKLKQTGLLVIDTAPESLSGRLISQYLDIKARHLL